MAAPVTWSPVSPPPLRGRRRAAHRPLEAQDLARVRVEIAGRGTATTTVGTAAQALADPRLTPGERAAVTAVVRAVRLLRVRAGVLGIDDAGTAVRLLLRDPDASKRGPWASNGMLAVGTRNALADRAGRRAREDVLLTVDAAVHELAHVTQFARFAASVRRPHAAILEGIADAVAMLATDDRTLGEGFFHVDANGRPRGAIRELGRPRASGPPIGPVVKHYDDAIAPTSGEHAAGGVVSAAFDAVWQSLGRSASERLLWLVVRDQAAWASGGSWTSLAASMRRAAATLWPTDDAARAAVEAALVRVGLDHAV